VIFQKYPEKEEVLNDPKSQYSNWYSRSHSLQEDNWSGDLVLFRAMSISIILYLLFELLIKSFSPLNTDRDILRDVIEVSCMHEYTAHSQPIILCTELLIREILKLLQFINQPTVEKIICFKDYFSYLFIFLDRNRQKMLS
jgi:hypothetical protein